jgi:hypothetical protein
MTTAIRRTPRFHLHSATSTARAIFLAALCAFIVTAFLVDVQRDVSRPGRADAVELRT